MSLVNSNPVLSFLNNLVVDLPCPTNISYFWNFGSLLGLMLLTQLLSGIFLVMHYVPHVDMAFSSVEHICRDVNYGWNLRYVHANGASFFLGFMYLHIARGMYYGSYLAPSGLVWFTGVVLFLVAAGTAFIGYVLVWGSMSLWGCTVITNLLTAIPLVGESLVQWVWGGFSVANPTLNRFLSLHYLFPFIILGLVFLHLIFLHEGGSNSPTGLNSNFDSSPFHPYFVVKDLLGFLLALNLLSFFVFFMPDYLGHSDNYIMANSLVTPESIVPEWYFLFAYAILRSIESKLGGVVCMVLALVILFTMPLIHSFSSSSKSFAPLSSSIFWFFIGNFILLTYLGSQHPEEPFVMLSQFSTSFYFTFFLSLPIVGYIENNLLKI